MKKGKKYIESAKLIDKSKLYDSDEALSLVCQTAKAKFDETVELHVKLGVDSRHADQQVRGSIVLPHGTGKSVKVLVFAKGDQVKEAEESGEPSYCRSGGYGRENSERKLVLILDVVIASPDMMGSCQDSIGRILGGKGLMPNPKAGTVTTTVGQAVKEVKAGKMRDTVWIRQI